jgi:type II secretory pathway pseudopilin PulG
VIAIIAVLAGLVLPALSKARQSAQRANCVSNLKQFSLALEIYRQDYELAWPPWLSNLYPAYVSAKEIYVCPADRSRGKVGHGQNVYLAGKFPEAGDYEGNDLVGDFPEIALRNPEIEACSYFYEFLAIRCSWWEDSNGLLGDVNKDGMVSWKEAKQAQARGLGGGTRFEGHVPVVRCFWHAFEQNGPVLNLAGEDNDVFLSELEWETTSR